MSKTVIAVFDSIGQARKAVQVLSETGLASERIRVQTGDEFVARAGAGRGGRTERGRALPRGHRPRGPGARRAVAAHRR